MELSVGLGASTFAGSATNSLSGFTVGAVIFWSNRASDSSSFPWFVHGSFFSNMIAPVGQKTNPDEQEADFTR
jgi:hypothetical protein